MKGEIINSSRFIHKAEITEKVEHFVPEHTFADFAFGDALTRNIASKGYTQPTPIQDRIIPHIMKGADVVGIANTGTGKTGAFLLPLIHKVLAHPKSNVFIMAPTRELATQINDELKSFTMRMKLFSVCCVGGAGMGRQIAELKYHNHFIVGTPGRLKDLIERKFIDMSKFDTVVIDEADRMLDMGFIRDVKFIVSRVPAAHQTLFFSATMSRDIEGLIKDFLKDPVMISVKTGDTSKNVDQDIVKVEHRGGKLDALHKLLTKPEFSKVLIFGKTKRGVEQLAKILSEKGFKASSIHGNKNQSQRERALDLFKKNHIQILVATDVAARGIDVPDITHVINYDIPATYDDYVHRIGRTGRGDKKGKALTFIE